MGTRPVERRHTAHGLRRLRATSTTTTLTYDVQGNLRTVQQPGTTITYTVDGRNRRIGKAVNGTSVDVAVARAAASANDVDGSGALVTRCMLGV